MAISKITNSGIDVPVDFNRTSTDGDIAIFQKDGTTVGSIGVLTDRIYLAGANEGIAIDDDLNALIPSEETGAARDNASDLGSSGARWRNIYLGGGVYLGGTAAANKLDDYEEGTWTPVDYWGAVSITVYAANYTKIGRRVFFELGIGIATNSSSNTLRITGLPFNAIGGGDDTSGAYVIGTNSGRSDLFLVSRGNNYIATNTTSNTDVFFSNYSNKQLKMCGSYTTT